MDQLLFFVPIIAAVLVAVLRFTELGAKRDVISGKILETVTLKLFVLNGLLVLIVAIAEYVLRSKSLAPIPFCTGIVLAVASIFLRRAAIRELGKFWSTQIEIRNEHGMVTSGPFQWVRHPTYLSMFLELLAIMFLLNSYWAGILIVVFMAPVMAYRIRLEEKAMIEKFGKTYEAYIQSTPMLFPYKLPRDTRRASS